MGRRRRRSSSAWQAQPNQTPRPSAAPNVVNQANVPTACSGDQPKQAQPPVFRMDALDSPEDHADWDGFVEDAIEYIFAVFDQPPVGAHEVEHARAAPNIVSEADQCFNSSCSGTGSQSVFDVFEAGEMDAIVDAFLEACGPAQAAVEDSVHFVFPPCGPKQPRDTGEPSRFVTHEGIQEEPFYERARGPHLDWADMLTVQEIEQYHGTEEVQARDLMHEIPQEVREQADPIAVQPTEPPKITPLVRVQLGFPVPTPVEEVGRVPGVLTVRGDEQNHDTEEVQARGLAQEVPQEVQEQADPIIEPPEEVPKISPLVRAQRRSVEQTAEVPELMAVAEAGLVPKVGQQERTHRIQRNKKNRKVRTKEKLQQLSKDEAEELSRVVQALEAKGDFENAALLQEAALRLAGARGAPQEVEPYHVTEEGQVQAQVLMQEVPQKVHEQADPTDELPVEVPKIIPPARIQHRSVEQTVGVPAPMVVEKVVPVPKEGQQERPHHVQLKKGAREKQKIKDT